MAPNLFDYATKELSQDAFICWLLECLNQKNHPVANASWALLERVLQKLKLRVDRQSIQKVGVQRQIRHVDIIVKLDLADDPPVVLVIEDKKNAALGERQLEQYRSNIIKVFGDRVLEERIYTVLMKTGYDFDLIDRPAKWVKVNYLDFAECLLTFPAAEAASEIFSDWVKWFRKERDNIEIERNSVDEFLQELSAGKPLSERFDNTDPKNLLWKSEVFQYSLFKKLFTNQLCLEDVREGRYRRHIFGSSRESGAGRDKFSAGRSIGGGPWIQYWFAQDNLFYRLDWRRARWTISLRYLKKAKNSNQNTTTTELDRMKTCAAMLEELLSNADFELVRGFRRSDKRDETTALIIDPCKSRGLARLGDIHTEFVRRAFGRS